MTEILLTLISVLILVYHAYYVRESNKEKKQLVDAIIAKSAVELRDLRVAENTTIKMEPQRQPDLVSTDMLDDEALLKAEMNTYE
jgi:hypothetical protein